jgi:hypothetical protein
VLDQLPNLKPPRESSKVFSKTENFANQRGKPPANLKSIGKSPVLKARKEFRVRKRGRERGVRALAT